MFSEPLQHLGKLQVEKRKLGGPEGPLPMLRSALCLQKPFSHSSGLSPSQETLGWAWERSRGKRETDLPWVQQQEHSG